MIDRRCKDNNHSTDCRSEVDGLSLFRSSRRVNDSTDNIKGDNIHIDQYAGKGTICKSR
jgi:hypothetical protein